MNKKRRFTGQRLAIFAAVMLIFTLPTQALAHCDTLDGPVVIDARGALEKGDVTPVLKWVQAADEAELREAFAKARAVRKLNPEAKALADTYFSKPWCAFTVPAKERPIPGSSRPEPWSRRLPWLTGPWRRAMSMIWPRLLPATLKPGSASAFSMPSRPSSMPGERSGRP